MALKKVNLKDFTSTFPLKGKWTISYHDASHLPPTERDPITFASARLNKTVILGELTIDDMSSMEEQESLIPFNFSLATRDQIAEGFKDCWIDRQEEAPIPQQNNAAAKTIKEGVLAQGGQESKLASIAQGKKTKAGNASGVSDSLLPEYSKTIYSEIGESLIRTRINQPRIDPRDWSLMMKKRNLIFITDTSAIRRGVISYLADVFEKKPIWVIIPVVSLLELQEASGKVKLPNVAEAKKGSVFLGSRPMSTSSTRELLMLKDRQIPIEFLEVPPQTLKDSTLKDRLILEGVKRIIKEKSTAETMYLLSGDIDMVRFAKLENIEAIYTDTIQLRGGETFYSARYDIYKRGFTACGVHEFLWDLSHVFSFIKAHNPDTNTTITLNYYFNGKHVRDWEEDIIEVAMIESEELENGDGHDNERVSPPSAVE